MLPTNHIRSTKEHDINKQETRINMKTSPMKKSNNRNKAPKAKSHSETNNTNNTTNKNNSSAAINAPQQLKRTNMKPHKNPTMHQLRTSPLKRSKSRLKAPSTVSTAHSDAFNAPIPNDEDLSYVELFQKYKSHVKARAHLDKIQHSRNERAARNFERNSQAYSNVSELRVTARFAKAHGEMSKDEGGFRVPMQPRISPVKRFRAMAMGERVLPPGEGFSKKEMLELTEQSLEELSFDNTRKDVDPAKKQRDRRRRDRNRIKREQIKKRTESPGVNDNNDSNNNHHNKNHSNFHNHNNNNNHNNHHHDGNNHELTFLEDNEEDNMQEPRAPLLDESLQAYNFHLKRHGERRSKRRTDKKNRNVERSRSSLAREWKRSRKKEKEHKRKLAQEQRIQRALDKGIHPDDIPEMYDDGKDDPEKWLESKRQLKMSTEERKAMHQSFNPSNTNLVVEVSSARLNILSSDIGRSTLQLQIGAPNITDLIYSANLFHEQEVPVDAILALTFNQKQRSAKQMRRAWRTRKTKSGKLEKLAMAQCGLTSIPEHLGALDGLMCLDLHSNKLTVVPDDLVLLKSLKILYLHANRLEKLPADFGKLKNLEELDVSQNLIAYLPDGIHKCSKLRHVRYNANRVMVMGIFPVPHAEDATIKSYKEDDIWEKVDGKWWGCIYKNKRTGTLKRKPPTGAIVVEKILNMREAKTWTGELMDLANTKKKRDKTLNFNTLRMQGAPMSMLRLALRNANSSEWEVGVDTNGDTYYETCLKDPGLYGQFLNRQYDMPQAMDRIGKMRSLTTLQLSLNGVRTIPPSIGTGPLQASLKELYLSFNKIRDLPDTICKLRSLEVLDLGNNLIEKLPANLGNCVKLRVIRLQFNKVEILPKSIGKLRALEILWLNNNYLKDLPPTLGHCKTIQDIKAKNNHEALSKRFDWEGGTASILYELRRRLSVEKSGPPPSVELVGIGVAGEVLIPKQRFLNIIKDRCNEVMLASEALGKVDLRARQRKQEKTLKEKNRHKKKGEENLFKEPEDEFKDLTINFNWMGLTEIPPEILILEKRLRILRMVGNKFKTIPNLAPLGGLLKLNLNANKIEELPDVFGKMRFLQELNLAENKLHQVPHSVFRLKSLIKLDVAHNKLVTLSSAIGRLRSVTEINMAANCLEEIPKEIGEAVTLRKIDFSNNCLRNIPEEAGSLFRLRKLNLNFNKLTQIPSSFAQLSSLKILLLCRNRIRSLPRELAAETDIAAEYEKLADQSKSARGNDKNERGNINNKSSCGTGDLSVGGSGPFAEKFIQEQYEDWKAWLRKQAAKELLEDEEEEKRIQEEKETGKEKENKENQETDNNGEKNMKKKKKKKKKNETKKPSKRDLSSPYMLLTGIVSGAVEEGKHIIQQQFLWDPTQIAALSGASSADDENEEDGMKRYQYARGIVCEIISSSSIIVRVTTLGRKNTPSVLFVPGSMLKTNGIDGEGKGEQGIKIGIPKTATQHRHIVLTFETNAEDDEDHEADDIGGAAGKFMLRLDRSAWLEQKATGAVGKVVSAMCLTKLPDVPEMFQAFEGMGGNDSEKETDKETGADTEGEKTEDDELKETKSKDQIDPSMMVTQADLELDEHERALENTSLVTVVLVLLSRSGAMFDTENALTVYSNVPLPEIPDDESMDGNAAAERHLMLPPTHVTKRVREMMTIAPFILPGDIDEEDRMERGRVLLQSSALEHAPASVGVLSICPQRGPEKDNAPLTIALEKGVNKEHREKLRLDNIETNNKLKSLRRLPLLIVTGRPVRHRKMYVCDDNRPMITSISESIGGPEQVVKQNVRLDPSRWARLAGKVGALALIAGRTMKKGAIKLLEKAVGEERAIEYEERAYKNFELGQARALMLRQSAIERSIAMKRGMKNSGGIMARASAAMRKNIRNRLIETVTGKYQLDDLSEDSDTPKQPLQLEGTGEEGEVLKVYRQDMRGMLVGGIKVLSKEEIQSLMTKELDEHQKEIQEALDQELEDIRLGRNKKKKKKKKSKKEKKGPAPLVQKASPLANALVVLRLSANRLTEVPETFSYFNKLDFMSIDQNPILSPPSLLANMGINHIRSYFALRSQRLQQLKDEMKARQLEFHEDRISPKTEAIVAKESRGHLTKHDLRAFDAQVDKLINGQIVLFRYTAKKIVKNLIRVAAKRQHWYHQKILFDFVQLCEVVELESLAFPNGFVSKKVTRPWGDGSVEVRVFIVSLGELFDRQRENPVSVVKMINERHKMGFDKTGFKWRLRELEEAIMDYKGIWKNGLPICQMEDYPFEDCIPDPDDKVYSKELQRMVAKKAFGGKKSALIVKRIIYTDDEVKRKKAEDVEIKRFYEPKLYRLMQWFDSEKGQERIHAKIYEKKTTLREEQSKAQSKAEEANTHLNKAKKSYFQMRKRKEAFDDGQEQQFHRFKDEKEAEKKFKFEQNAMGEARAKYNKFVAKVDYLRAMVARKPHEWEEWSENEFKLYVENKVKNNIIMRRRKIANIKGWRRPWDGFEGNDYNEWRTGKGCQFHPKWMDEIPKTESDEDSSFSVGEDPNEKEGSKEKK